MLLEYICLACGSEFNCGDTKTLLTICPHCGLKMAEAIPVSDNYCAEEKKDDEFKSGAV